MLQINFCHTYSQKEVNNWCSGKNVDFGYKGWRFKPQHQNVFSLSKRLYRIASVDSDVKWVPGGDNLVKGVQCYELFGGIALKINTFSFSFFLITMIWTTIGLSLIYALLLRYWNNLSYPKFLPTSTLTIFTIHVNQYIVQVTALKQLFWKLLMICSFLLTNQHICTSLAWLFFSIWYNWSYYPCTPSTYWLWIYW